MTTTLKPCPLCGAPFKMGQEPHDNGRLAGMFYIYHDYGPLGSPARKCPLEVHRHFDSAEEAARAWNSRHTPATDTQDSPKFNAVIHAREDAKRDTNTLRETVKMLAEQRRQNTTDTQKPVAWRRPDADEIPGFWLYYGLEPRGFKDVEPLFTQDQLDAAVRAERERCAKIADDGAEQADRAFRGFTALNAAAFMHGRAKAVAAAIRKVE